MGRIQTLEQLRAEIAFLRLKRAEEEIYLNQTFRKVNKAFNSPLNFIKGSLEFLGLRNNKNLNSSQAESDWVTNLGRLAVPFLLNKTILRGRGMIFKTIVSLISQSTINSKNLNKNVLANWIDKVTYWINVSTNSRRKKATDRENDYGIPSDSETYSGRPVH